MAWVPVADTAPVQGFLGVMVAGQVLFYFLFKLGKLLRRILQHAKSQVLEESVHPPAKTS